MKWNNLKQNKCPNCFGLLKRNAEARIHECPKCNDFHISEKTFDKIVDDLYRPKRKRMQNEDERMSELNNLGTIETSDDFLGD